jgi:hypothetical protein
MMSALIAGLRNKRRLEIRRRTSKIYTAGKAVIVMKMRRVATMKWIVKWRKSDTRLVWIVRDW